MTVGGTLRYEIAASNAATTNGPNSITFDIGPAAASKPSLSFPHCLRSPSR